MEKKIGFVSVGKFILTLFRLDAPIYSLNEFIAQFHGTCIIWYIFLSQNFAHLKL